MRFLGVLMVTLEIMVCLARLLRSWGDLRVSVGRRVGSSKCMNNHRFLRFFSECSRAGWSLWVVLAASLLVGRQLEVSGRHLARAAAPDPGCRHQAEDICPGEGKILTHGPYSNIETSAVSLETVSLDL